MDALRHRGRFALLTVLAFLAAGFLTYGGSLHNAFLTYDDDLFVTKHPLVTSGTWSDLPRIFTGYDAELYMPLTIASLKLDYAIGGADPFAFHLTSLLLHILGACLATWLFFALFKRRRIAFFLGAVFLLHPLNTEVVTWIAARKDALSTPFYLAAAIAYLYGLDRNDRRLSRLSLALFAVGLTAKYMIVSLPALLLSMELLRGAKPDRAMLRRLAPFLGVAAFFTLVAALGKQTGLGAPAHEVALLAGKTVTWYLRLFLFPDELRIAYLQETPVGFTLEFVLPWLAIASVGIACWVLRRQFPGIALGLALFFVSLIPTFPAAVKYGYYFGADHYVYLPMFGLLMAVGWAMTRMKPRHSQRRLAIIACGLLIAECASLAHAQAGTWRDSATVFTRVLQYHPCSTMALNNRGAWFAQTGDAERAKADYAAAVSCEPDSVRLHLNFAAFLDGQGDEDGALAEFSKAVTLDPLSAEVHFSLGLFFQKHGREDDAKAAFANALKLDPGYVDRKLRNWAM